VCPGRVNLVLCAGESMRRGDTRFDLGTGVQRYRMRFRSDIGECAHFLLLRPGLRPFHSPVQLVPVGLRRGIVATRATVGNVLRRHVAGTSPLIRGLRRRGKMPRWACGPMRGYSSAG
jgi:CelD/BcsL family acetyltransferase involved in cellulose biosynthesis